MRRYRKPGQYCATATCNIRSYYLEYGRLLDKNIIFLFYTMCLYVYPGNGCLQLGKLLQNCINFRFNKCLSCSACAKVVLCCPLGHTLLVFVHRQYTNAAANSRGEEEEINRYVREN